MAKQKMEWVSEATAAEIMGLTPKYLRECVKKRRYPITYSRISGKKVLYSKTDIDNLIYENSSQVA